MNSATQMTPTTPQSHAIMPVAGFVQEVTHAESDALLHVVIVSFQSIAWNSLVVTPNETFPGMRL